MMPELILLAGLWYFILCGSFVPWVAHLKGRSGFGWFLISLLYSPLLALIALAAIPDLPPKEALPLNPFDVERARR